MGIYTFFDGASSSNSAFSSSILSRMSPGSSNGLVDTVAPTADVPTITVSTTQSITSRYVPMSNTQLVTMVGDRGTWNNTGDSLSLTGGSPGVDFFLSGTACEFALFSNGGGNIPALTFVNGLPISLTPTSIPTPTNGIIYYVLLTFPSSATRRVEFFPDGGVSFNGWYAMNVDQAAVVAASPRRPVVGWVGDSFYAGSAAATPIQSTPWLASRLLGVENSGISFPGTGYLATNSPFQAWGDPARVAIVTKQSPELLVFSGSVNDEGFSSGAVATAALSCWQAYHAALPNAKMIVLGPQPSAATSTLSAARTANNKALKVAAATLPYILGYVDQVGTAGAASVPAWSASGSYSNGDLVTYNGSVYQNVQIGGPNAEASYQGPETNFSHWQLLTFGLTGTGEVGSPVGDGTRDTFVYSDGIHPTVTGSQSFSYHQARSIRAVLQATV